MEDDVEPMVDDDDGAGFVAKMENEFKLATQQQAVNSVMGRHKRKRKGKFEKMRLEAADATTESDTDKIAKAEDEYQRKMAELKAFSESLVEEAREPNTLAIPTDEDTDEDEDTEESELLQSTATEGATEGFEEEEEPIDVALSGESRIMK